MAVKESIPPRLIDWKTKVIFRKSQVDSELIAHTDFHNAVFQAPLDVFFN